MRNSVKSKKSESKATDGTPGDGVTPPSIRVSQIDLSHMHSSTRQNKMEAPNNAEEPYSLPLAPLTQTGLQNGGSLGKPATAQKPKIDMVLPNAVHYDPKAR